MTTTIVKQGTLEEALRLQTMQVIEQVKQTQRLLCRITKLEHKIDERDLQITYLQGKCDRIDQDRLRIFKAFIAYINREKDNTSTTANTNNFNFNNDGTE